MNIEKHIHYTPLEIWNKILTKLSDQDIAAAKLACKALYGNIHKLEKSSYYWKKRFIQTYGPLLEQELKDPKTAYCFMTKVLKMPPNGRYHFTGFQKFHTYKNNDALSLIKEYGYKGICYLTSTYTESNYRHDSIFSAFRRAMILSSRVKSATSFMEFMDCCKKIYCNTSIFNKARNIFLTKQDKLDLVYPEYYYSLTKNKTVNYFKDGELTLCCSKKFLTKLKIDGGFSDWFHKFEEHAHDKQKKIMTSIANNNKLLRQIKNHPLLSKPNIIVTNMPHLVYDTSICEVVGKGDSCKINSYHIKYLWKKYYFFGLTYLFKFILEDNKKNVLSTISFVVEKKYDTLNLEPDWFKDKINLSGCEITSIDLPTQEHPLNRYFQSVVWIYIKGLLNS